MLKKGLQWLTPTKFSVEHLLLCLLNYLFKYKLLLHCFYTTKYLILLSSSIVPIYNSILRAGLMPMHRPDPKPNKYHNLENLLIKQSRWRLVFSFYIGQGMLYFELLNWEPLLAVLISEIRNILHLSHSLSPDQNCTPARKKYWTSYRITNISGEQLYIPVK